MVGRDVSGPGEPALPTERHPSRGGVAAVKGPTLNHPEPDGRIGDRASMGTDRVLRVRDGHDAGAAREAYRGLDSNHTAGVRGADDAAVGLGAEGQCGEVG